MEKSWTGLENIFLFLAAKSKIRLPAYEKSIIRLPAYVDFYGAAHAINFNLSTRQSRLAKCFWTF
jgi:hypothetical protein